MSLYISSVPPTQKYSAIFVTYRLQNAKISFRQDRRNRLRFLYRNRLCLRRGKTQPCPRIFQTDKQSYQAYASRLFAGYRKGQIKFCGRNCDKLHFSSPSSKSRVTTNSVVKFSIGSFASSMFPPCIVTIFCTPQAPIPNLVYCAIFTHHKRFENVRFGLFVYAGPVIGKRNPCLISLSLNAETKRRTLRSVFEEISRKVFKHTQKLPFVHVAHKRFFANLRVENIALHFELVVDVCKESSCKLGDVARLLSSAKSGCSSLLYS